MSDAEMAVFGFGSGQEGNNQSEDGQQNGSSPSASTASSPNSDDLLEPVERLEKYSMSDIIFHRQVAARSVLETLHEVRENEADLQRVAVVISRFATDSEPSIRAELIEQLPHITSFCLNQINCLPNVVPSCILPILEQFLTDSSSQVRKITQNSLAIMLEQGFVNFEFVEDKICPVLVHLMDFTNLDDYRIEAVTTVSKIIRFLGREVAEKVFLQHFSRLCSDVSFHVRRVCAATFGEFSTVVGQQLTESVLLPQFRALCEDGIWGVRKACADVFVPVSCVCSNDARRTVLAPLFVGLLCDQSKWVKTAAFQALGPFISTFADPNKTGLYYNDGGVIVVEDMKDQESNDSGCSTDSSVSTEESEECESHSIQSYLNNLTLNDFSMTPVTHPLPHPLASEAGLLVSSSKGSPSKLRFHENSESCFNTFQFWRIPIPELQIESDRCSKNDEDVDVDVRAKDDACGLLTDVSVKISTSPDITEEEEHSTVETTTGVNEQERISERPAEVGEEPEEGELSDDQVEAKDCLVNNDANKKSAIDVQSLTFTTPSIYENDSKLINSNINNEGLTSLYFESDFGEVKKPRTDLGSVNIDSPVSYGSCYGQFFSADGVVEGLIGPGLGSLGLTNSIAQYRKVPLKQDIIPNDLLEHYLSMTNPVNYQTVDPELNHHCAYSLPAVALTLGRKHWPCLKETYELLASDMQWKVRWTLAASLHQMALILGPEYTTRDLLPVFLSFMKDLDEVRFGILQNLAAILKLLNRPEQLGILPKISEFLKMDNHRNWRFRYTLTEQVMEMASLYESADIKEYLLPIAFNLLKDKVAEVRLGAIRLLSILIRSFFCDTSKLETTLFEDMRKELLFQLNNLINSPKWISRQAYVFLGERLAIDGSIPASLFLDEVLMSLLSLASDPVANVRLAVSRCLASTLCPLTEFQSHLQVKLTLQMLRSDTDGDVRRFAESIPESDPVEMEGEGYELITANRNGEQQEIER